MTSVVVIGSGGNIGSHLVPHLARTPGVQRIMLVDPDTYEPHNLRSQDMRRRDLGQPKALVQARRLRAIAPALTVEAVVDAVEHVPLGRLRGDVMLSCLDSRTARRAAGALAWRLGVPLVDAGVHADELLARVNVYRPGPAQPCYECAFDDRDYAALAQAYPCAPAAPVAPTNAPSALGALAASLQALECRTVLERRWDESLAGRQVVIGARARRALVTAFRANPRCRFDHDVWDIEPLAADVLDLSTRQAMALLQETMAASHAVDLKVVDQLFVQALTCVACGARREFPPYLAGRLGANARVCERCGGATRPAGFDAFERLHEADCAPALQAAALRSLGLRPGDVLTATAGSRTRHFEIGGCR